MSIQGVFHVGGGAASVAATFQLQGGVQYLITTESGEQYNGLFDLVEISPRLGNIPRKIALADGHVFSSADNDGIDRLIKNTVQSSFFENFIHLLESNLKVVGLALLVTICVTYSVFRFGVPATANWLAEVLPPKTNEIISHNSLEVLDEIVFEASELPLERRIRIENYFFNELLPAVKEHTVLDLRYKLHFRSWPSDVYEQGIPNAFALPGGDIILTDQFVRLTETDHQLASVLLHEIGHIKHRHSLKTVIRTGLYSGLLAVMLGDLSTVADIGVGVGALLVQSHYSRHHETEADDFSFEHMLKLGIDPQSFVAIFQAMDEYMDNAKAIDQEDTSSAEAGAVENSEETTVFDYLSSHPQTKERLQEAKRFSECFKQGLIHCPKTSLN